MVIKVRVISDFSVGTLGDLGNVLGVGDIQGAAVPNWGISVQVFDADLRKCESVNNLLIGGDVCVHLAANTGVPAQSLTPAATVLQMFRVH